MVADHKYRMAEQLKKLVEQARPFLAHLVKARIDIGVTLQQAINYLSNFWDFSGNICGDCCNEILLRFPKEN